MRSHSVWNAAAAVLAMLMLPVLAAADQPDTPTQPPREIVVRLGTNPPSADPCSALSEASPVLGDACDLAMGYLGSPYRWGGTTPKAFDCSGFVRFVYSKLGIKLPRTARQQFKAGQRVTGALLRAGDLVFFDMMKGYVSHVGMYLGGGLFIHASTPRSGVRIDAIDLPKYRRHIVGARRYVS